MKKFSALIIFGSAIALSSCGKGQNQEETCTSGVCTEQSINAPVGPQPEKEPEVPYDSDQNNPRRDTLKFPAYNPAWGLTRAIFDKAVRYYAANRDSIPNPRYFTIVDFNLHSTKKRMFLFDLSNGRVEKHNVAAGKNSDPDADGFATKFSNTEGSLMSSLGFYRTLSTYNGKHGLSLHLRGLDSTNNNAEARAVVLHPANYVSDKDAVAGRSWGCPAVDPSVSADLIGKVKNGSALLIDK